MKVMMGNYTGDFYLKGPWDWSPFTGPMTLRWVRADLGPTDAELFVFMT